MPTDELTGRWPAKFRAAVSPKVEALLDNDTYLPIPDANPRVGQMHADIAMNAIVGYSRGSNIGLVTEEFLEKISDWERRSPIDKVKRDDAALAVIDFLAYVRRVSAGAVTDISITNGVREKGLEMEEDSLQQTLATLIEAGMIEKNVNKLNVTEYRITRSGLSVAESLNDVGTGRGR